MKLIGSLTSPYVRKARIVMAEKKLDYRLELENVWASDATIQQFNPLGKVPVLEAPPAPTQPGAAVKPPEAKAHAPLPSSYPRLEPATP